MSPLHALSTMAGIGLGAVGTTAAEAVLWTLLTGASLFGLFTIGRTVDDWLLRRRQAQAGRDMDQAVAMVSDRDLTAAQVEEFLQSISEEGGHRD